MKKGIIAGGLIVVLLFAGCSGYTEAEMEAAKEEAYQDGYNVGFAAALLDSTTPKPTVDAEATPNIQAMNALSGISLTIWPPTSADGIDIRVAFTNGSSSRVIKYITFYITPYNGVGDVVACTVRDVSTRALEITGPVDAQKSVMSNDVEAFWYNSTIESAEIESISIEYMDGSLLEIDNITLAQMSIEYKEGKRSN